ncbi:MAG TPA: PQQ-dependent sugar dehydrogenase [Vicinamibacterales bacterium]|jgi:glucose/arabinose dehydrogenase|nr:PQQ-dependent sugar dehydrogenase [Vicinamibacterales bacterium]
MHRSLAPLVMLCALAACGETPQPPDGGDPPPGGETITGRERIGWIQPATDSSELATFSYVMYVDGARRTLSGAACSSTAGATGFDCSAPLPSLSPGAHTLELATFTTSGGAVLESGRSTPLQVNVSGVVTAVEAGESDGATVSTRDGVRLQAQVVARALDDPTDMAFAPDGRLFIAERAGLIRAIAPRTGRMSDVGRLAGVSAERGGLLAMTLAPDFQRSGALYVVYTAAEGGAATIRLLRAVERGGTLAQAAVLLDEPAPGMQSAAARFGPDGMLYLAVGDAGEPRLAQELSSPLGKILRLTPDGTAPRDNPGASPIFSVGHRMPSGIAWQPERAALWEVERNGGADEINRIVANGNYGWPLMRARDRHPRGVAAELTFPEGTLAGASFFSATSTDAPFHGDLFVASHGGQDVLRVEFVNGRPAGSAERLLQGRFGRIGQVVQSPTGELYFSTANRDTWGAGQDLAVRLSVVQP